MSQASAALNPYDEIPYLSQPLPQTHPDRLATVALLFGMQPRRINHCRVLEIGCATGGNLIPMADRHPESRFLGIDYSRRQIDTGRQTIAALGLKNIELAHQSIADLDERIGQFDYIICHGVFSWVTHELQEKLFSICKSQLAPQGVAYVSYNAYPSWHFRHTIRELAHGACAADAPAHERIGRARGLLEFFHATLAEEASPASQMLRADIGFLLQQTDSYLFHEYLEEENHPLYFHEFAARARVHGFQYLGETQAATMFPANFGPAVERNLRAIADDVISIEQHMDLLRNCSFRQTLLCHADVPLSRHLHLASLEKLYLASQIKPTSKQPDLKSHAVEQFVTAADSSVRSATPTIKAALCHLGAAWPRAVSLDELLAGAAARLGSRGRSATLSSADRQGLANILVQCLACGMIEPHCEPDAFVTSVSEFPRASELARAQAAASAHVVNRRHEGVALDEISQNTLAHLDGTVDRAALLKILIQAFERGRLSIFRDGVPIGRGEPVELILEKAIDASLQMLASHSLLVA